MPKHRCPSITKNADITMLDLPDCISLSERGGCGLLNISKCQGKGCTFKKNRLDSQNAQSRWMIRLSSLDIDDQIRISRLYYDGKMSWNK